MKARTTGRTLLVPGAKSPREETLFDWTKDAASTKRKLEGAYRELISQPKKMCGLCKESLPRGLETQGTVNSGKIFQFWKQTQWGPEPKKGSERTCLVCTHAKRLDMIKDTLDRVVGE